MTTAFQRIAAAGVVLLVVGAVSLAFAQPPRGRPGSPMYNVNTEATITGTVESVDTMAPPEGRGRRGLGGTHLIVKTETKAITVHLGPAAYLSEHGIAVAKGDAVEILGSQVTMDGEPVVLARRVTKGESVWTLRDESGRPLWSGPRRER